MKRLSRDIACTLVFKCFLLFLLWFIFMKDIEKPTTDVAQRLLNSTPVSDLNMM